MVSAAGRRGEIRRRPSLPPYVVRGRYAQSGPPNVTEPERGFYCPPPGWMLVDKQRVRRYEQLKGTQLFITSHSVHAVEH